MLEKHVENKTCKSLKQAGALPLKLTSQSMAGLPDRLVLVPGGKVFFIEFKRPGAAPRPLQISVHRRLEKLGFKVLVIDQPTRGEDILNAL